MSYERNEEIKNILMLVTSFVELSIEGKNEKFFMGLLPKDSEVNLSEINKKIQNYFCTIEATFEKVPTSMDIPV